MTASGYDRVPAGAEEIRPGGRTGGLGRDEEVMLELQAKLLEAIRADVPCGPFMAAIYDREGNCLAEATNTVEASNCSHNHAEMNAIRLAEKKLGSWDLGPRDLVLYTTSEPCMMCLGAVLWSGIRKVVYGVPSEAVERLDGFDEGFKPQWKAEFAKRGIEVVGPVAQSAGEDVHREYIRRHPTVYMPKRNLANQESV